MFGLKKYHFGKIRRLKAVFLLKISNKAFKISRSNCILRNILQKY